MSRFLLFLVLSVTAVAQPGERGPRRGHRPEQEPPSPAPRPLRLDAVVTDAAGQPVRNLTAADFDLHVDNQSVALISAEYVKSEPRRLIAIVDDVGISGAEAARLRDGLHAFVNGQKQPSDEISILRTRSGSGVLDVLTSDKVILLKSIDEIVADPAGPLAGKGRERLALAGAMITLRRALGAVGAIPGRKGVVLISTRLAALQGQQSIFERPALQAANSEAVVYTLDAGVNGEAASLAMADETGGLNLGRGVVEGLGRAVRDLEGRYILRYHTGEEVSSAPFEIRAPGKARLTLKNTALQLRTRTTALGPELEQTLDHRARTEGQELATEVNSPFNGGDIQLQVTGIYGNSRERGGELRAMIWVDAKDLTFTHQLNGRHKAGAEVVISVFNTGGMSAAQLSSNMSMDLSSDEYAIVVQHGAVFQGDLSLRQPGVYQLRATVRDATSGRIGKASGLVDAPDTSGGELAITGLVLSEEDSSSVTTGPARRIFKAGARIGFGYAILNPGKQVHASLRLLRDGTEIFAGAPQNLPDINLEDPKRRPVAGEVTLGAKLESGRYYLELTIRDTANGKAREVVQGTDFEVRVY